MSGNIDDLDFALNVSFQESLQGLRQVVSSLNDVQSNIGNLAPAYDQLNAATMRLAALGSLPVKNAELLMAGIGSIGRTVDQLGDQIERMETRLETAVASSADLSEHWQYVNRGVKNTTDTMRQFAEQAKQAAAATQTIVVDTATAKVQQPSPAAGGMLGLASSALAIKASTTISRAMTVAKNAITGIGTSTTMTISKLDRFRMGLAAPAVNPALNKLPDVIDSIATKTAKAVEAFRGFGDATVSGVPQIMTAIAGGMSKVMGAGDGLQATVSKITSAMDLKKAALDRVAKIYPTTGTAVDFLKQAMDFIAPAARRMASTVDRGNESFRQATISARNLAFIATGTFAKTGTSADLYARGAYHALLLTRLMAFESKFAANNMLLLQKAIVFVTTPFHSLAMALQRGRGEFRELRANLPPLTGGLQLGTRAMRALAHGTFFASTAIRAIIGAARPLTAVAQQMLRLVQPARMVQASLHAVQSSARAATASLQTMASVGNRGFGPMISGAKMAATAVAGIAIAASAMGTKVAMATEKNQAVFGVMLKDMEQGKAVVASLQNSAAVGLFDNAEVLNSGRLLFKAGVAAQDLAAKTDQLATIAAATSTELGDLTRIYQQGANRGSFQQDKINQFAERGIDIYHALTAVTGKSGDALSKMITDGKIGITEMDAALAHLTTGTGIYAGALDVLGNTTSGMMATIKNNIMQALGQIAGSGTEARKPFMDMLVGWSESVKNGVGAVLPIIDQFTSSVKGLFYSIAEIAIAVYSGIFGAAASTFGAVLAATMSWVTKFRWFFENLLPIAEFTWLTIGLGAVTMFNDMSYWVTDTMPAYLTWFSDNWINVFKDIGTATYTIFSNMAVNIKSAMQSIWAYIKSGGTADLEFAFVPLMEGFESTVAALPDIPDRAMTALEESMAESIQNIGTELANNFDKLNMEAQAALELDPPKMPEIKPGGQDPVKEGGEEADAGKGNKRSSFLVSGLERGSEAALEAVFAAQKSRIPDKQLSEQKMTNKHLKKLVDKPAPAVLGRA